MVLINIVFLLLFFMIVLYLLQGDIDKHKKLLKEIDEFKQIERHKVDRYLNYNYYGAFGFRIIMQPSLLNIFFSDSVLGSEFYAALNIIEKLNLESSHKGKELFNRNKTGYTSFAEFIFLIGSLFSLFYGFNSLRNKEYLKLLSTIAGERILFLIISVGRLMVMALLLIITILLGILSALINGIAFSGHDYLLLFGYCSALFLIFSTCFFIGLFLGTLRLRKLGVSFILGTWACFVLLFPIFVNKLTDKKAQTIVSNSSIELFNWNCQMEFEQRASKEMGEYTPEKAKSKEGIDIVKSFLTNEYKKIQEAEKNIENEMRKGSSFFHWVSAFTPGTFSLSLTNELSSQGYNSVTDFFKYSEDLKDKFAKFYSEKEFSPQKNKLESFIKGDMNVFKSKSRLPGTFWPGMGIMAFYAFVLMWVGVRRFEKYLYHIEFKTETIRDNQPVILSRGKYSVFRVANDISRDYLYSLFNGQLKPKTKQSLNYPVLLDGKDITSDTTKHSFCYIPAPAEMPGDIRVTDFLHLISSLLRLPKEKTGALLANSPKTKTFGQLKRYEIFEMLVSLAGLVDRDIFLIDKSEKGMYLESYVQLKKQMEDIAGRNGLVIFLEETTYIPPSKGANPKNEDECVLVDITCRWGDPF